MCHMWSRKAKIQPQMAVSGNADIFSIKVDSRLKTILFSTGVAPKWILIVCSLRNSYLAQSAGSGSVVGEGFIKCQISPNHPLKLVNLAEIFTGNSVYIREWICIGLAHSRATLIISISGVWRPMTPQVGNVKYITILPIRSPNLISCIF